jgi:hypothetical protein
MAQSGIKSGVSQLLQELACYVGSELVFDKASEALLKIGGVDLCDKQIERICHHYGQKLEDQLCEKIEKEEPKPLFPRQSPTYCMPDGGMVFTREQEWKEMKLMRLFQAKEHMELSDKRSWIHKSFYLAHLGDHREFCKKAEFYLDPIWDLIFVADGAPWIWNWIDTMYPDSTQILDFYHASEHLWAFANIYFKDDQQKQKEIWIEKQIGRLLEDEAQKVIQAIEKLPRTARKNVTKSRNAIINYYNTNLHRMQYKTFREDGYMIGSGPIESAHRNVIQHRLKLSGQRWTIQGAQQIANLRACKLSDRWRVIQNFIENAA